MAIKKVLIVDDSKTETMFMREILEKAGYAVESADTKDATYRQIDNFKPDLILMDIVMPDCSGYQLTRDISRSPESGKIPIIICSSKSLETDKVWGMRQGAKGYITKPVNPAELLGSIKSLSA